MSGPASGSVRGGRVILLLTLGFAALVAVGLASVWLVARTADEGKLAARTLETKTELLRALTVITDAETGQRGFLLTQDQRYLGPYTRALEDPDARDPEARFKRLRELIGSDRPQAARLDDLLGQFKAKVSELTETVKLQREGRREEALAVIRKDDGRLVMREIRRLIAEMTDHEDRRFAERADAALKSSRISLTLVALGLAGAAALAAGAHLLLNRQNRELERAQAALAEANSGLEAAVVERTADLTAANEEIQRFAYIVSHDLRAPLVNVMGFTSELDAARKVLKAQIERLDDEESKRVTIEARQAIEEDLPEAISFIRASTAKMDRLINAILKLSRDGRRAIKPESVSVEDMAKGIADTIHLQTVEADAKIVIQPGLPPLVTDRLSVEQIFQNLIENAVKYLDRARPGRIEISGRRVGALVEYSVADNGRGIDPKDHERVFELFRRAGRQDQPGEGLGLAFVRANVRKLGGTISLASEPGQGSTFHLTFPAVFQPSSERSVA